jgi:hypothetical protein
VGVQEIDVLRAATRLPGLLGPNTPDARKAVDYWTTDAAAMLRAYLIMNSQERLGTEFIDANPFDNLTPHMPVVTIAYTPGNTTDVTLYPFNYWSIRKIPGTMIGEIPLFNTRAFSWITLDQKTKSEYARAI